MSKHAIVGQRAGYVEKHKHLIDDINNMSSLASRHHAEIQNMAPVVSA